MNVLHFSYCFFEATSTFIYNILRNHKKFTPIITALTLKDIRPRQGGVYKVGLGWPKPGMSFFPPHRFASLLYLRKLIRKTNPSIIHAHFGPWACFILPLRKITGIPLVVTFYGYDVSLSTRRKTWLKMYNQLFDEADLILAEGPFMKKCLEELGCPTQKIRIQKIGIDLSKLHPAPYTLHSSIIFAGRLEPKKGIMDALAAVNLLRNESSNFTFIIIGSGALLPQVKEFIYKNKMDSYTRLLGSLPYAKYVEELRRATIFLHPSYTTPDGDTEGGAPTTILEAQALELPVVSTFHADIPNITLPQKSALLSKERDVGGLCDSLKFLLQNPSNGREMGKLGRQFVIKNHAIALTMHELEQKYLQIIR